MDSLGLALLLVVVTGWHRNTSCSVNAMGLCEFARNFPLKESGTLEPTINLGGIKHTSSGTAMPSPQASEHSSSETLAITSTTFESTLGQSTERRSSAVVSFKNGQTLLRKLTTTQENTSRSPTDKSFMISTIGPPIYTSSGAEMSSPPASEHSSSASLAITSTTFKSTLGQSTERRSSAMVSYKNGQILLRKLTTTQENTSLSPTDKYIMISTIGHPKHTPSGAGMSSPPATEYSSSEPLAITSTTFESTLGQSTETRSSAMVSYKSGQSGQTLVRKLTTTTQENISLSPTDKSIMTSTIGCPPNMMFTSCLGECESDCQQPNLCYTSCSFFGNCFCPRVNDFFMKDSDCVPAEECGCFIQGQGVIPDNAYYTSDDCSYQCFCLNDILDCYPYLNCSDNATCEVQNDVGHCYCNEGFEGDGEICSPPSTFTDCNDVYNAGYTQDGVYSVSPLTWNGSSFDVFCSMTIDGGGWTVFQRRVNGSTDFYKSWDEYKEGFGDNRHEFWLGNEKLYHILQQGTYEVRVDTVMSVGAVNVTDYHTYANFQIDDETNKYRVIDHGQWSGTQGGAMYMVENVSFSTYDQDNDGLSYDCVAHHQGGWWYGGVEWNLTPDRVNCRFWLDTTNNKRRSCTGSNPNGVYGGNVGETIFLDPNLCNVYYLDMKIRRIV